MQTEESEQTSDILLGMVMITEYPLSVVFSICIRLEYGEFDLNCTGHRQSYACTEPIPRS